MNISKPNQGIRGLQQISFLRFSGLNRLPPAIEMRNRVTRCQFGDYYQQTT